VTRVKNDVLATPLRAMRAANTEVIGPTGASAS
jgi:hypothetical protein